MQQREFARRLAQLRTEKGVSARDMSLSIGQSPNYINTIEAGHSYPSMAVFFSLCEYLGITPAEFFDTAAPSPGNARRLHEAAKALPPQQLEHLLALVKDLTGE